MGWCVEHLFVCISAGGHCVQDLHGEVMACGYEDVQVMWSILDKSQLTTTTHHKIHNQLEQTTHHFLKEGIVR